MRALPALAALTGAGLLLWPTLSSGYVVQWPALDPSKRDFRVFNNFTDPEANDNTATDANWPGFTGAPLAIWKGACEWGSGLHGDGSGDPTQPGDVGSGGANLDPFWLGLAPNVGAPNDDVASELNGSSVAIIAFTEFPPNDGWRVRFYASPWIFDDDPAGPALGTQDLQGVFTHEYGHCLGLDHTPVAGATMEGAPLSTVDLRSIEIDDIQGVQAIYGRSSTIKPRVRALTLAGGTLTLLGEHFDSTSDLEFLGASATGLSTAGNGTIVQLALPGGALAGDVQLTQGSGALAGAGVSNAYPLDPGACPPPGVYCSGKPNSQGCPSELSFSGSPSASSAAPFLIDANNVINQRTGLLLYSLAPAATPFQGGILCLGGGLKRTPVQSSGGNVGPPDCSGAYSFDFNARIASGFDPNLVGGVAVYAQYIYRDPPSSFGWGLTEALAFTICP